VSYSIQTLTRLNLEDNTIGASEAENLINDMGIDPLRAKF